MAKRIVKREREATRIGTNQICPYSQYHNEKFGHPGGASIGCVFNYGSNLDVALFLLVAGITSKSIEKSESSPLEPNSCIPIWDLVSGLGERGQRIGEGEIVGRLWRSFTRRHHGERRGRVGQATCWRLSYARDSCSCASPGSRIVEWKERRQ